MSAPPVLGSAVASRVREIVCQKRLERRHSLSTHEKISGRCIGKMRPARLPLPARVTRRAGGFKVDEPPMNAFRKNSVMVRDAQWLTHVQPERAFNHICLLTAAILDRRVQSTGGIRSCGGDIGHAAKSDAVGVGTSARTFAVTAEKMWRGLVPQKRIRRHASGARTRSSLQCGADGWVSKLSRSGCSQSACGRKSRMLDVPVPGLRSGGRVAHCAAVLIALRLAGWFAVTPGIKSFGSALP